MRSYCEGCKRMVDTSIHENKSPIHIRGRLLKISTSVARCASCGKEVYSSRLRDENLNNIGEAIRKENWADQ